VYHLHPYIHKFDQRFAVLDSSLRLVLCLRCGDPVDFRLKVSSNVYSSLISVEISVIIELIIEDPR
jgi:hypothetical protein